MGDLWFQILSGNFSPLYSCPNLKWSVFLVVHWRQYGGLFAVCPDTEGLALWNPRILGGGEPVVRLPTLDYIVLGFVPMTILQNAVKISLHLADLTDALGITEYLLPFQDPAFTQCLAWDFLTSLSDVLKMTLKSYVLS